MDFDPISPDGLVEVFLSRCTDTPAVTVIAVDGPDATQPERIGAAVADRLRGSGRAADVVRTSDFLRPASVRLEFGRTDAQSFRDSWFDFPALDREVISSVRASGKWLPRLWDSVRDRSFRDPRRRASPDQVLIITGPMLLGRGLDFDVTMALRMSAGALARRTDESQRWTIDPLLGFAARTDADIEVRYDHPDRPAVHVRNR